MDKSENQLNNYSHGISIIERKSIIVTGVKKIESFDNEEFLMDTIMGFLAVKGENLELIKLDTLQGNVSIKGVIKSLTYIDDQKVKDKDNGIFNRLFK